MNEEYRRIIEESIRIELQVAELYLFFYRCFPQDEGFWWQIAIEEKNHAALIRSLIELSEQIMEFPADMFSNSLSELVETNRMLSSLIDEFGNFQHRCPLRHLFKQRPAFSSHGLFSHQLCDLSVDSATPLLSVPNSLYFQTTSQAS